jgi:hypothetical protein
VSGPGEKEERDKQRFYGHLRGDSRYGRIKKNYINAIGGQSPQKDSDNSRNNVCFDSVSILF